MKKYNLVSILVLGFCLGLMTVLIAISVKENDANKAVKPNFFVYQGFADYSIEGEDSAYFYAYDEKIESVKKKYKYPLGIVQKPETAAKIGLSVLVSKFGEKYVSDRGPYSVVLVNHRVWKVFGNLEEYEMPPAIYIQAADGQILGIYSNKK